MHQTLAWGVLSTARINRKVVPAVRAARGATLVGVASRSGERAAAYAREHGFPRGYGSYDELLADPKIDCVYNPLPNSLHREWTIRALRAGKHVLCEKPFTRDAAEAEEVAGVARETGKVVMEAFMYRFHPQWERARAIVEDGDLGELRMVRAEFAFHLADLNNIRLRKDLAGGALMDVGCYCLDACRQIARCEPVWISALAEFSGQSGVDERAVAILRFPGEVVSEIDCSFRTAYRHTVDIIGTKAHLRLPNPWTPGPDTPTELVLNENDRVRVIAIPPADEYRLEVEHFCEAVRGSSPLRWPVEDAIAQMRAIDAVYRSARTEAPVTM